MLRQLLKNLMYKTWSNVYSTQDPDAAYENFISELSDAISNSNSLKKNRVWFTKLTTIPIETNLPT